jgi:hypothetical protein
MSLSPRGRPGPKWANVNLGPDLRRGDKVENIAYAHGQFHNPNLQPK